MEETIRKQIFDFIVNNFIFDESGYNINEDDSLLEGGIIDSTGVLELVAHIEETYNIRIDDDDIVPENLDSITNISLFIFRKISEIQQAGSANV